MVENPANSIVPRHDLMFTGWESERGEDGWIVRHGTYSDWTSPGFLVVERERDGVVTPLFELAEQPSLDEAEFRLADWAAVADRLIHAVRELQTAKSVAEPNTLVSHGGALLDLGTSVGGALGALARVAGAWASSIAREPEVLVAVSSALPWMPLLADAHDDPDHVRNLVNAGWTEPDSTALDRLRSAAKDLEEPDAEEADETSQLLSSRITTAAHASSGMMRVNAARTFALSPEAVRWATSGEVGGCLTTVEDVVHLWSDGRLTIEIDTGDVVGADLGSNSQDYYWAQLVGDVILATTLRETAGLDSRTLEVRWTQPGGSGVRVEQGLVLISTGASRVEDVVQVRGVDVRTGELRWSFGEPRLHLVGSTETLSYLASSNGAKPGLVSVDRGGRPERLQSSAHCWDGRILSGLLRTGDTWASLDRLEERGATALISPDDGWIPWAEVGEHLIWIADGGEGIGLGGSTPPKPATTPDGLVLGDDDGWARMPWVESGGLLWCFDRLADALIGIDPSSMSVRSVALPGVSATSLGSSTTTLVVSLQHDLGNYWLLGLDPLALFQLAAG